MRNFFNKTTVLSALLCVVFGHDVSSQETNAPQSHISKPSEDVKPQSSSPSVALKEPNLPKSKEKLKPIAAAPSKPEALPPASPSPKAAENLTPTISSTTSGWFVGIRGSYVPGVIGELGYQFNTTFKLRLIGGGFIRSHKTFSVDGQTYNKIRVKPLKVGLMADWHLWKNGFRLTGGVAYNGDRIRLNHTVTGNLLGQPANVYGTITANYKYRWAVVPYLGLGYDSDSLGDTGIRLSADAGFWFQGKVRSRFTFTGTGQNSDTIINAVKLHTENLINKNKLMRTVPMVSVGIRYMF